MRPNARLLIAVAAPGLALALWLLGLVLLVRAATGGGGVAVAPQAVGPVAAIAAAWWLAAAAAGAYAVRGLWRAHVLGPARLLNAARIMATDAGATRLGPLPAPAAPLVGALAAELEGLAGQRAELRAEMTRLVDAASRSVAEQRDQLAALMAELDHAVVVCNLEGRILLYNDRARQLARRLAPGWTGDPAAETAAAVSGAGAGRVGLGRRIQGVIEPAALDHALETVGNRLARGVGAQGAVAQFVTATESGQLLQVSLAPVRPQAEPDGPAAGDGAGAMTGYVLMLDDITEDHESQSRRDQRLLAMTEASRASAAAMQAALDLLDYPDLEAEDRARFVGVIRAEVGAMVARLAEMTETAAQEQATRWPLQDMLGTDLIAAATRRLGRSAGAPVASFPVADEMWLRVDSFGLIQALDSLAGRLRALSPDPDLWLRLAEAGGRAHLDLGWRVRPGAPAIPTQALSAMPAEPMGEGAAAASVRDVVERHGGEIWLERSRDDTGPFYRMLLPLAAVESTGSRAETGSRPEFYDFDLFAAGAGSADDDRPLAALAFTVFDCETTGLDPSGGDEIIQVGAVRIVNGRILRTETIDQLVDPQRSIPEAGIPIHHIHPHMVRGQPVIGQVLPVFHRFAEGSVLVGHNVAFDMRFLKLKEATTGCVFDHPVLDTLLLSSIVHPAEDSHSLEAIAERLGITIGGRHTALGDALATAEVFARLIPLLARQGVVTLGQARAASGRSQFARLRY